LKKIQIIFLNLIIIGLSIFILIEDYNQKGQFQLVDQNAIEDDEELYLNVISLLTITFGIFSIISQIIRQKTFEKFEKNNSSKLKIFNNLLKIINSIYSICLIMMGGFILLIFIGGIGSGQLNDFKDLMISMLIFFFIVVYSYLGVILLLQTLDIDSKQNEIIPFENILDDELY